MKRVVTGAVSVFALLFILFTSSCIVTSHEINVDISCDDFTSNENSIIRNDFNVEVGDKIRVKLCSNPTTGFQWNYETIGQNILKEEDRDFEEPKSNVVGASGKDVWTFEATEKGSTEIHMEYSRNWEGGEKAEWEYTFTVKVE